MTVRRIGQKKALVRVDQASRVVDISDVLNVPTTPEEIMTAETEKILIEKFNQAGPRRAKLADDDVPVHIKSRREKMIQIGEQSVAGRGRVFKHLPHVPASRKNQAYDGLIALLLRGRIKMEDKIAVRHLKTGEYDDLTVGQMLDEVGDMYLLQLKLRERDKQYRDQVNTIFKDSQKSDEDKAKAIDGIELPEFLDVDEESTSQRIVSRRANGKTDKAGSPGRT